MLAPLFKLGMLIPPRRIATGQPFTQHCDEAVDAVI
jgi:hypothetical protein